VKADPGSERAGEWPRRRVSRRAFLGTAGGVAAGAVGVAATVDGIDPTTAATATAVTVTTTSHGRTERFYGVHQGGITTAPQAQTMFVALDVTSDRRQDVAELLRAWTRVAADLTSGRGGPAADHGFGTGGPDDDEAVGLGPARLTVNFGFGPSLFGRGSSDRFGLGKDCPEALVDLPAFPGDQLDPAKTGGDLTIHACADDPQVVFHAARQLVRAAEGVASLRWSQTGFNEQSASRGTPRNLMGFKDGTMNPSGERKLADVVWVRGAEPAWMDGGTYVVVRRIRMDLDQWDSTSVATQERTIGRYKRSGAPLGRTAEFDALDLSAKDADGDPVVPLDAHVRIASPQENWNNAMLRRSYGYNDDALVAGPASAQETSTFDAGLLFVAYQQNPRQVFIPIYAELAARDALRRFTVHTGSAIAAIPPGAQRPGSWIGEHLLD
jgi:deferrochelatase/peroxidase EfeB